METPGEELADDPDLKFALGVGVGCLWLAQRPDDSATLDNHFDRVRDTLASIENLTDLTVKGGDGQFGSVLSLSDGDDYTYPNTYWTRIKFDLYIPAKVQRRLDAECGTESVSVHIENHYHFPVTYVFSRGLNKGFDPSTAVILVRRYLEEKLIGGELAFGSIGPSPFHANFITAQEAAVSLQHIPGDGGYRDYVFTFSDSDTDGLTEFTSRYGDDFSLYYHLHNLRRDSIQLQSSIINESRELVETSAQQGWWPRWRQMYRARAVHDSVSRDIMFDQLNRSDMKALLSQRHEEEPSDSFEDLSFHF